MDRIITAEGICVGGRGMCARARQGGSSVAGADGRTLTDTELRGLPGRPDGAVQRSESQRPVGQGIT